ncbi:alpha/beta hydrolase [Pedobacter yulinensis]|uniref:Alpha/beta hydrolase n=1 Tax=Pedobacter yulinensis TaxID=2126353 RepID=A0A2T3HJY1_9SPHI|nr:alpha/beta hydrolase [Pedobacter yulinensis]PST82719.1 alpha/beta hydrolase [Pedobacter yulinensis]
MKKNSLIAVLALFICCRMGLAQGTGQAEENREAKKIIADLDSIVAPGGVQEKYQLSLGNMRQWIYVRGQDRENPIVLFVHGGPASPMSPLAWSFQRPMEEYFTFVNYDQRASGKTYAANDTAGLGSSLTIERYADDAIELAGHLLKKYGKRKLILIGHSWGTIVGMKAALKRPDLFYAYVGIGQVINTMDNERLSFQYGLQQAKKHQNKKAIDALNSIAPYPGNQPVTRERIIIARTWPQYYGGLSAYRNDSFFFFNLPLLSPDYTAEDVNAIGAGSLYTLDRVMPEFLRVDFKPVKRFPIPVFMFMGRHDYTTPSQPPAAWLDQVAAPKKKAIWFERSAHLIPLEEPGKLLISLVSEVRPLALK